MPFTESSIKLHNSHIREVYKSLALLDVKLVEEYNLRVAKGLYSFLRPW